jgi:hypothetical protein
MWICAVDCLETACGAVGSIAEDMAVLPLRRDAEEGNPTRRTDHNVDCKEADEEQVEVVD